MNVSSNRVLAEWFVGDRLWDTRAGGGADSLRQRWFLLIVGEVLDEQWISRDTL